MIKYEKVIYNREIETTTRTRTRQGVFTLGKQYILSYAIRGMNSVKIYDDNLNAIEFSSPSRCGFGRTYPLYTNFFDTVCEGYVNNKRNLRKLLIANRRL